MHRLLDLAQPAGCGNVMGSLCIFLSAGQTMPVFSYIYLRFPKIIHNLCCKLQLRSPAQFAMYRRHALA